MDNLQMLLAVNIALLRRLFPPAGIENQILEGLKIARKASSMEAIAKEAGDEPAYEEAIVEVNKITATTSYQTVVSKTITKGRMAKISRMEMACREDSDYDNVYWRITVNSKIILEDKMLPSSLTLDIADLDIRGGKEVKIEAKTSTGTVSVWGDITGKEII